MFSCFDCLHFSIANSLICETSSSQPLWDRSTEKATETELPDEVTVVCNGMEGTYIRKFHAYVLDVSVLFHFLHLERILFVYNYATLS